MLSLKSREHLKMSKDALAVAMMRHVFFTHVRHIELHDKVAAEAGSYQISYCPIATLNLVVRDYKHI
jgi:hypothetical protein